MITSLQGQPCEGEPDSEPPVLRGVQVLRAADPAIAAKAALYLDADGLVIAGRWVLVRSCCLHCVSDNEGSISSHIKSQYVSGDQGWGSSFSEVTKFLILRDSLV